MHPFKGPAARALKRALRFPRELRAKARDRAALSRPFQYYLSACAIFRNEAPYLEEWLVFHLGIGVEHFYLYENRSTDDFRGVLAPFVERRQVTLVNWPKAQGPLEGACGGTFEGVHGGINPDANCGSRKSIPVH